MDREFLDLYNQELQFLQDHAEEFAREYPGIAERLGGLVRDAQDPMIGGLLEGAAFLASRVQLKLKHEFSEFTSNYIDQLLPNYLAPIPSALIAQVRPPYSDPALREGIKIARGDHIEATYLERERRIACRYQLREDVVLWPLELTEAAYLPSAAALQAQGVPADRGLSCGMRLAFVHRNAAERAQEPSALAAAELPDQWVAGCTIDTLPIHLVGPEPDAILIYEQLFAHLGAVWVRWLDKHGDPLVRRLPLGAIEPVGLGDRNTLLPEDTRVFRGFQLLQEYFLLPQKFLAFRLTGLQPLLSQVEAKSFEIVFAFNQSAARLGTVVTADVFKLYATPAINLFEKSLDRITITPERHEYHVVPDRSRVLDFEPHRLTEVYAHLTGGQDKVRVRPLYSAAPSQRSTDGALYYTIRRLPRRRSAQERRYGVASSYSGTDVFLSISEPPGAEAASSIAQVSMRGLCSNRHLTEQLPVGDGGVDFTLLSNTELEVYCVAGPTRPRPPIVSYQTSKEETSHTGRVAWRLINLLALNQLGLIEEGSGEDGTGTGAQNLRELLGLFSDPADAAVGRRVAAIRSVGSRPIVRRMRSGGGYGAARGLEVTVTLEEKNFEGSGAFLLGAVLDRFFAEYVSINRFTQTVLRSVERGEIKRWPPRSGRRPSL